MHRTSKLQHEIKQSKPFGSAAQEAALALLRTADLVRRNIGLRIEPHGVTPQQYNVLRILRGAGEKGLPTLEIAERMIEQTPGITRLIDRLETKGYVLRERCIADRRQVFCHITAIGLDLLARLEEPVAAADEDFLRVLSPADLQHLIELLDRVRDAVHEQITKAKESPIR